MHVCDGPADSAPAALLHSTAIHRPALKQLLLQSAALAWERCLETVNAASYFDAMPLLFVRLLQLRLYAQVLNVTTEKLAILHGEILRSGLELVIVRIYTPSALCGTVTILQG